MNSIDHLLQVVAEQDGVDENLARVVEKEDGFAVLAGAGTGLPKLVKYFARSSLAPISAIAMTDDGGGSRDIRRAGGLPPGDFWRVVLAHLVGDNEKTLREFLAFRHPSDDKYFPNQTNANIFFFLFERWKGRIGAVSLFPTLFSNVRGWPFPVTTNDAHVCVEYSDRSVVKGEGEIDTRDPADPLSIIRMWLEPEPLVHIGLLQALQHQKNRIIVIAPGSWHTSLLPVLQTSLMKEAIGRSHAPVSMVINLMTHGADTRGFDAATFVEDLIHNYDGINRAKIDLVVVNTGNIPGALLDHYWDKERAKPVAFDQAIERRLRKYANHVVTGDFLDQKSFSDDLIRHDDSRVGKVLEDFAFKVRGVRTDGY